MKLLFVFVVSIFITQFIVVDLWASDNNITITTSSNGNYIDLENFSIEDKIHLFAIFRGVEYANHKVTVNWISPLNKVVESTMHVIPSGMKNWSIISWIEFNENSKIKSIFYGDYDFNLFGKWQVQVIVTNGVVENKYFNLN